MPLPGRACSLLLVTASLAAAQPTPFGLRVNEAIDRGLEWIRATQDPETGRVGRATGLAMLALMDRPESADPGARALGYDGLALADQAIVRRGLRACIETEPGFVHVACGYQTGTCLMAMARYLVSGGPDDVGAPITIPQAVANAVASIGAQQGDLGTNRGGWSYCVPEADGDLSVTQFAMAGLAAASTVLPGAADRLPRATDFLENTSAVDGGHEYRGSVERPAVGVSSMTATGVWSYRLAGAPTGDPRVQAALGWLRDHYRYDSIVATLYGQSYFYYAWVLSKALEVTVDDGSGDFLFSDGVGGVRDPAADAYPEELAGWYYDVAWFLTEVQNDDGSWCNAVPMMGWPSCWHHEAATVFAVLTLERSLGGVCFDDDDEDGVCALDDNCPEAPNPDQLDGDGDGLGDACDPCPEDPNLACICPPNDLGDVCNGLDDDCDDRVDEDPPADENCATGLAGACSAGRRVCVAGEAVCLGLLDPAEETCDGVDQDCDGGVDEEVPAGALCDSGQLGACAAGILRCVGGERACVPLGEATPETCDGRDEDCDGAVDEGGPGAGEPCAADQLGVCEAGRTVCADGAVGCVSAVEPAEEVCNLRDDDCDGAVDEGAPEAGAPCETGLFGECAAGRTSCEVGVVACDQLRPLDVEKCDARDNDCDGAIDEELFEDEVCDTGLLGVCRQGVAACRGGVSACEEVTAPSVEVCDGLDNDCDDAVDEGDPGSGAACETGWAAPCGAGVSRCEDGRVRCVGIDNGAGERCDRVDEDCDGRVDEGARNGCGHCGADRSDGCEGRDDDCDGWVDEDAACVGGLCVHGGCRPVCNDDGDCEDGFECRDQACARGCVGVECPARSVCRGGLCFNPCDGVRCEALQRCVAGVCTPNPCRAGACPQGWVCRETQCVQDPCRDVRCVVREGVHRMCRDGHCVASCADVRCGPEERCADGRCVFDECPEGACLASCEGVECMGSAVCVDGRCVDDPCATARCPPGERCIHDAHGLAQCEPAWDPRGPDMAVPDAAPPSADAARDAGAVDAETRDRFVGAEPGGFTADRSSDDGGCGAAPGALRGCWWVLLCGVRRRRGRAPGQKTTVT